MNAIRNAPIAKSETIDGEIIYVDGDIYALKSLADLEIYAALLQPNDSENDWLCLITFNPSEKISESSEVIVAFHDTCVQINNELNLANEGIEYDSITDRAKSKSDYFFQ